LNKLVIFGVGLIGGSLALALRRSMKELHIVGVGRSGESLQNALDLGVINEASISVELALRDAEMVIIAVPVAQTPNILKLIAPHINNQTVITDVGSTKSDGDQFSQFVPGHPIAGAEKSGVSSARADLFDTKNIVLTPTAETSDTALNLTKDLWMAAGARVTEMSASHHDQIFAAVSHLPHLLAFALVENLAMRRNAEELFAFAASGFRDFTRIAGSSPEMWRDISLANRNALMSELESYQASLSALHSLLDNRDAKGLQALFEKASHVRNDWSHPSKKP
jgi:prephenate dehydrogenase